MKAILDHVVANSAILIFGIIILAVICCAAWRTRRKILISEVNWYWKKLHESSYGCDAAFLYWDNGDAIIARHGYLPYGCSSRIAYCIGAIESLSKYIGWLEKESISSPELETRTIMLRQDLKQLEMMLLRISPKTHVPGLAATV